MKHLTIESDVSQDAQGEVDATWRWDYSRRGAWKRASAALSGGSFASPLGSCA